jgi:hypothetical protein
MGKELKDVWLGTIDGRKALRVDFANDCHHGRCIDPPYEAAQLVQALYDLADQMQQGAHVCSGRVVGTGGEVRDRITLTVAEIKDLAECAGFTIEPASVPTDPETLGTEITVIDCPKEGVKEDDNRLVRYAHVAYFDECPGEGCHPLGEAVP